MYELPAPILTSPALGAGSRLSSASIAVGKLTTASVLIVWAQLRGLNSLVLLLQHVLEWCPDDHLDSLNVFELSDPDFDAVYDKDTCTVTLKV